MASVDLTAYDSRTRKHTQRERKTPPPCRFDFAAVPDLQRWIGRWGKKRAAAAARVSVDSLDKMTAGELVAFASVDRVRKVMGQPCPPDTVRGEDRALPGAQGRSPAREARALARVERARVE